MGFEAQIESGLHQLGIQATTDQVLALDAFVRMLSRWNRVYNLTAVREPGEMVSRHILDCASVCPSLQGPRILDVGSGAGLPGIPLAVLNPALAFVLLDASGKRTRFMRQACIELALDRVSVVQERVERYRPDAAFDTVISRAFSSLGDFVDNAGPLRAPSGRLLAMKGRLDPGEIDRLPPGWHVPGTQRLHVPGVEGARHLLTIEPKPRD